MNWKTITASAVIAGAAAVVAPVWAASAASHGTTAPLCRQSDIEYYYGGGFAGLGQRSFQITLLAHDGVACRLSDRPQISLQGPPGQHKKIKLQVLGQGGTLVLTASAPLHTSVNWYVPDTLKNKVSVQSLRLRMPGGGITNTEPFLYPGTSDVAASIGVTVYPWETGIGAGQNANSF